MKEFRNILVSIVDGPSQQALLTRAARLAKHHRASLKLIACVEDLPWYNRVLLPGAEELQESHVRERSAALEGLAAPLRQEGLDVSTRVLKGRAALETIREVLRGGHDLLMKVAEPNEGVLFGSADMRLLRTCPVPLWLFKPGIPDRPYTQLLTAVDPPPVADDADVLNLRVDPAPKDATLNAKILDIANALAVEEGAVLEIIHAWSAPGEEMMRLQDRLDQNLVERYVEDSRVEAQKAFDKALASLASQPGRRATHLLKGDPAEVIVEYAKTHPVDLIVMGTVARTGIPGLLIGNTAESILQRVDCSVLAVKPDSFVCPVTLDD